MKKQWIVIVLLLIAVLATGSLNGWFDQGAKDVAEVSYHTFYDDLEAGEIESATIYKDSIEYRKIKDEAMYTTVNPQSADLVERLLLKDVVVTEDQKLDEKATVVVDAIVNVIFFAILFFAFYKLFSMTQKSFPVVRHTGVHFSDIAGMEEIKQEMMGLVDVLKRQGTYHNAGIRPVKGVILEGPPGNGKTLFAKALAEEAHMNFIATKGADFQSAMMSVGTSKIKGLFKRAKRKRPCIIFIDEFDAIGEKRSYGGTGVDKENNRNITAMLNEMDGFEGNSGILVIAATNSYASLDEALVRPGRFDIKFHIGNPDYRTRQELIALYTKKKPLVDEVKALDLAEICKDMSCSAIEALLNEAAVTAVGQKKSAIDIECLKVAANRTNQKIFL